MSPALEADWMGLALGLARERTTLPLARAARVFMRDRGWIEFGYARAEDHARERFGRSGRWVRDLSSLAEAVEELPELGEAITGEDGGSPIGRVVALMVGRVATPRTIADWISLARTLPVRELRAKVRAARESASAPIAPDTDWIARDAAPIVPDSGWTTPAVATHTAAGIDCGPEALAPDSGPDVAGGTWRMNFSPSPRSSIASSADSLDAAAVSGAGECFPGSGFDVAEETGRMAISSSPRTSIAASADSLDAAVMSGSVVGECFPIPGSDVADEARRTRFGPAPSGLAPSDPAPSGATGSSSSACGPPESPELEERCTIRLALPAPVLAALNEARDLHSALCGGDTGLAAFIEALAGETLAGPCEPLPDNDPRPRRRSQEEREADLARVSGNWEFLLGVSDPQRLGAEVRETLLDVDRLCDEAASSARDADALVRALIRLEDEIERRLGQILATMSDTLALRGLSFAGVGHYAEQRLGISRTTAEDRARLARALRGLPVVQAAYEDGRIGFQAASLICRILAGGSADPRLQAGWVEHAEETTIKRLRDEMRLRSREKVAHPTVRAASPVDDATWHRSLERSPGDAIARVAEYGLLSLGDTCRTVIIPMRLPADLAAEFLDALSTVRQSLEQHARSAAAAGLAQWSDPDVPASFRAARAFSIRCGFVPEWVALLAMIEDFVATWDDPRQSPQRDADRIYIRDGWRCSAPGCTSRRNLEEHHVQYRSRGGCRGEAPLALVWRMGRYGRGGMFECERRSGR